MALLRPSTVRRHPLSDAATRYTRFAMLLHWLVAVLIVGNVVLALVAEALPDAAIRPAIDLHKSVGITVAGLVLLRILWRAAHPPPPLPRAFPAWERAAAHAAHLALYGVMLGLPLSGWLHDSAFRLAAQHPLELFWLVPFPRLGLLSGMEPARRELWHDGLFQLHAALAYALYALLALHVLGALKHQFVDGRGELGRILPWGRAEPP